MRFSTRRRPSVVSYDKPPRDIVENTKLRRAWLAERLAARLEEGFEAKIVGTGSYQSVSYKAKKVPQTRLMLQGLCQICQRRIGATNGVIAHHGYERPGDGWQTASCEGARYLPLSESTDRAAAVGTYWAERVARLTEELEALPTRPSITIAVKIRRGETELFSFTPDNLRAPKSGLYFYRWADVLEHEARALRAKLQQASQMQQLLENTVRRWQNGEFAGTTREYEVEV